MASLPSQDTDAACEELERCKKMGAVGNIQMFSNVNGEAVFLEKFLPFPYMRSPTSMTCPSWFTLPCLSLHPSWIYDAGLPYQLWGYTLDTSMAVMSMIFQGVFAKYPKLTLVHGHLGGTVPYFVRRIQDAYKGYGKEWGIELKEQPDITYKNRV